MLKGAILGCYFRLRLVWTERSNEEITCPRVYEVSLSVTSASYFKGYWHAILNQVNLLFYHLVNIVALNGRFLVSNQPFHKALCLHQKEPKHN